MLARRTPGGADAPVRVTRQYMLRTAGRKVLVETDVDHAFTTIDRAIKASAPFVVAGLGH